MQKLLSAIALFALVAFASCQKENLATAALSEQISLDRGYSPADALATDTELARGGCDSAKVEEITFEELPASAQDWLTSKTDTAKIKKIVRITCPDGTVTYAVGGANGRRVRFDSEGNLTSPAHGGGGNPSGGGNGGGIHGPCDSATVKEIAFADLPADAQEWLTGHLDTAKIQKIVAITCPDGTVTYAVSTGGPRIVRFDAEGNVVLPPHGGNPGGGHGNGNGDPNAPCANVAPEAVTVTDLPQLAQDWLTQNAADKKVASVKKVTRPDCEVIYEVKFTEGGRVRFDKEGNKI